ncbi:MAG: EF-hand domain-containing protein [archaeon]|nr:EF-hand domain-containing protein [archaeon]
MSESHKETEPTKKKKNIEDYTKEDYIAELEPEEVAKITEIFDLFDKNFDGGVDSKELRFILNSLEIYPNQDELSAMMAEADTEGEGEINAEAFKYIIAKQKVDYKNKLVQEASKIK